MKGLLIKDFYNLLKYSKSLLIMIFIYSLIFISGETPYSLLAIVIIFGVTLTFSSFAYDDQAQTDQYILSLPIERNDVVRGKYLLGLILTFICTCISLILSIVILLFNKNIIIKELYLVIYILIGVGILSLSFVLPLIYKYGVEKGRLLMFLVLAIPMLVGIIVMYFKVPLPSVKTIELLLYCFPVISLIVYYLSYKLSSKIYGIKQF